MQYLLNALKKFCNYFICFFEFRISQLTNYYYIYFQLPIWLNFEEKNQRIDWIAMHNHNLFIVIVIVIGEIEKVIQ